MRKSILILIIFIILISSVSCTDKTDQLDTSTNTNDIEQNIKELKLDPSIGMTTDQVRSSSWGKPDKVEKLGSSYGVNEKWIYSNDRYIIIEGGLVKDIKN